MAVTHVANGTYTAGTGNATPPIPGGATTNDVMVLICETDNQVIANDASLKTAGWTEFTSSPQGTTGTRLTAYWKRHDGSESNPALGDAGDHTGGQVLVFRGCITTGSPINAEAGSVAGTASTSVTFPTITTTEASCLVVNAVVWSTDSASAQASAWTNASLASITEIQDSGSTAGNGGGLSVAIGVKTAAGSVSATTATLGTSATQGRLTFALTPEPLGAGPHTLTANDSGSNYKQGSSYPPGTYAGDDDGGTTIYVSRLLSGGTHTIDTAYVTFDPTSLAGGDPIDTAKLRLYITAKSDGNNYMLAGEYYDFAGSSDVSDWAEEVTSPAFTPVDLGAISTSAYLEIDLTDLSGAITSGTIGIRLTLYPNTGQAAAPTTTNSLDITSHTGTNKPQLVVTLGAGSLTAARSVATTWNVAATVNKTRSSTWHVKTTVNKTRSSTWNVLTSVTQTRTTTWNTRAVAGKTRTTTWNTWATVAKTRTTTWRVLTSVNAARTTTWAVRANVGNTRTTTWDVYAPVGVTRTTTWNVLFGTAGTVAITTTTTWNVAATAATTRATSWNVRATTAAIHTTTWRVLTKVNKTRTTTWRVWALVGKTRTSTWHVRARAGAVCSTSWNVLTRVTSTRTTTWRVLTKVGKTRTTTWRVRATVGRALTTAWNVLVKAHYGAVTITIRSVPEHHSTAPEYARYRATTVRYPRVHAETWRTS